MEELRMNRRSFLKKVGIVSTAFTLPSFSIARSRVSPSGKLRIACVGIGGIGKWAVKACLSENLVALCDVDQAYAAPVFDYAPDARRFSDFRVMFDQMGDQIDAVVIATPDHTHFPIAMKSLSVGKHVFLEKPLCHSIEEIRLLQAAARKSGVITQMGNQGHSTEAIRLIKEWTDAGVLGSVREVHAWTDTPVEGFFEAQKQYPPIAAPVPDSLDWDLWLGPAAYRAFSHSYLPMLWRGWWDFGSGMIGDNTPHTFDAPFWALGLGSPTKVEVELGAEVNPYYTPFDARLIYHFPERGDKPAVKLYWYQGSKQAPSISSIPKSFSLESRGMVMIGDKNSLYAPGFIAGSPRLVDETNWQQLRRNPIPKTIPRIKGSHYNEWLDGIKLNVKSSSDFEYGGNLSELSILGALAIRTGKSIEWNARKMEISNHPELNPLLRHHARAGWDFR